MKFKKCSLKVKIAFWFARIASLAFLAFGIFTYSCFYTSLRSEFDRNLKVYMAKVDKHLFVDDSGEVVYRAGDGYYKKPMFSVTIYATVRTLDGKIVYQHPGPHNVDLPTSPTASMTSIETADGTPLRVFMTTTKINGQPYLISAAKNEASFNEALGNLISTFLWTMLAGVILLGGLGYWFSGKVLGPIDDLKSQLRKIDSDSLGTRLHYPNPNDELGELACRINDLLARLERSFEALRQFTADASHELRTPITAIRSQAEVALRSGNEARYEKTLHNVLEEAEHITKLVESLLALARADAGNIKLERAPFCLFELSREIIDLLSVLAHEKNQKIEIQGSPSMMVGDRAFVKQAVVNLIHNAIRYAPEGGEISVKVLNEGSKVRVSVADNGPGIDFVHQEKIFERFYRADKARSRAEGGFGLGLSMVKWIVDKHDGQISLNSTPGKGSEFHADFPA